MSNVMSMLKLQNHVSKNGFDLSRKNAFTAKVGELLPCLTIHTLPNSEYDINVQSFTRTMPLNTAAFTRIKEYYDFYFVPLRLLYRYAPQMFAQSNEQFFATSATSSPVMGELFPYITMQNLYDYISYNSTSNTNTNDKGYNNYDTLCKLLQYLDYGDFAQSTQAIKEANTPLNIFPLLAYQKIYQDYFRNSQWETAEPRSYNIDFLSPGTAITTNNWLSNSDFVDCIQLRYCNYPADYFLGVLPNSQYGDVATINVGSVGSSQSVSFDGGVGLGKDILLQYYFTDADGNKLSLYNANTGSADLGFLGNGRLQGYESVGDTDLTKSNRLLLPKGQTLGTVSGTFNVDLSDQSLSFDILQLRKAEATQKFREISQPNDKDYKGQMKAHFEAHVPAGLSLRCQYLGGTVSQIQIGDVINQNLVDDNDADIKGKGTCVNNGHIHFQCQEHGIIMGIYHAIPLLDYSPNGLDRFNTKIDVSDYAIPEFDRIGMQETYFREILCQYAEDNIATAAYQSLPVGYAPRYAEYKTAVDKVHGAFYNGGLQAWYAPLLPYDIMVSAVASDIDWSNIMKVNPNILDSLFTVATDSTVKTDRFLVNGFFDVKAVLPLDRNGLPY